MPDRLRASLAWGKPAENGLAAAVALMPMGGVELFAHEKVEPLKKTWPRDSVLEQWYYIYHVGAKPVSFSIGHWLQDDMVSMKLFDRDGKPIRPKSIMYTGATAHLPGRGLPRG